MATTKQYQATKAGGPFALVEAPVTAPGPNEVSIRLRVIGLNPADWKQYMGMMVQSWPKVLGFEGAGTIEAVGADVTDFRPGDEVMASFGGGNAYGAFQEVALARTATVAKKPKAVSWEEAASLPIGFFTAASAVYGDPGLKIPLPFLPGSEGAETKVKSVLVLGGSSVVGASAIQILRLALGPSATILATSSPRHHERLTSSLGATKAFDQNSPTLVQDVKAASPDGQGVDAIVDAVGAAGSQKSALDTLRAGGPKEYAMVLTGANVEVPEGVTKHAIFGAAVRDRPGGQKLLAALAKLVEDGEFKIPAKVETVGHGLESIDKGLETLKAGVSGTKLVITV